MVLIDKSDKTSKADKKKAHEHHELYDLSDEIQLATEIIDIIDELKIISHVIEDQKGVVNDMGRIVHSKESKQSAQDTLQEMNLLTHDLEPIKKVKSFVERLRSTALHEYKQVVCLAIL